MSRTDTVIDTGEFAVRGSIFDIFPSGLDQGLRLDFFGDELEIAAAVRSRHPAHHRPRSTASLLLPAREALLDEDTIKRFRTRYRETFGATATGDPLYQAVSDGRRLAGMEHWLPLFEEKLATLFDHLGADDLVVIDDGAIAARRRAAWRRSPTTTPTATAATGQAPAAIARSRPTRSISTRDELAERARRPAGPPRRPPFAEPESATVVDFGFARRAISRPSARAATTSTRRPASTSPTLAQGGARPLLAAYSDGSRSASPRSSGADHGPPTTLADSWQEALGLAAKGSASRMVLPLDTGFANDELELVTEQDLLGDRLVRRRKRARIADAFLAELSALNPAISSSTSITASAGTSGSSRSPSARARTTA